MFQKKSLGQNFLKSKKVIADIARAGEIAPGEVVLEAGPGEGILTSALLSAGAKVIAVEKDRRLISFLKEKFSNEIRSGKLELIEGDILEFSIFNFQFSNYKLIANIPYYITGALIRKFLEAKSPPKLMVILVQKEVAERIVARDGSPLHLCHCHKHRQLSKIEKQNLLKLYEKGLEQRCGGKESLLSISVKAYGAPKYIATVKAGNFSPAPKVDSAILAIENISKKFFVEFSEEQFFKIVKLGFAHKRKRLAGNLKNLYPNIEKILGDLDIDKNARPEDLGIEMWRALTQALSDVK